MKKSKKFISLHRRLEKRNSGMNHGSVGEWLKPTVC